MKRWVYLLCCMLLVPSLSHAARLQVRVPAGIPKVSLLSPGTDPVLDHLRGRLNEDLKTFDDQYHVEALKKETEVAQKSSDERLNAYKQGGKAIREEYIAKLSFRITRVSAFISPESSALGEIAFNYVATNHSDRIVSDVVYVPRIGTLKIPTQSKLVLEFMDSSTLKSGLAPGRSLGNAENNPERFSFFIGELSKTDLEKIRANLNRDFAIDVQDIHFASTIEYKDQGKVMDAEHAFQARLKELELASEAARKEAEAKLAVYHKALSDYNKAKEGSVKTFAESAQELKKDSVRFTGSVDEKHRSIFEDIPAGTYFIYASDGKGKAVFQEVRVKNGRQKMKIEKVVRDPFQP